MLIPQGQHVGALKPTICGRAVFCLSLSPSLPLASFLWGFRAGYNCLPPLPPTSARGHLLLLSLRCRTPLYLCRWPCLPPFGLSLWLRYTRQPCPLVSVPCYLVLVLSSRKGLGEGAPPWYQGRVLGGPPLSLVVETGMEANGFGFGVNLH